MMYEACGLLYQQRPSGSQPPGECRTGRPRPGTTTLFSDPLRSPDGISAGPGASRRPMKDILEDIGIDPAVIRRAAIAAYEAEMNVVMYAERGEMTLYVTPDLIHLHSGIKAPGSPTSGWPCRKATRPPRRRCGKWDSARAWGFPTSGRNADRFEISSEVGKGTRLEIYFDLRRGRKGDA